MKCFFSRLLYYNHFVCQTGFSTAALSGTSFSAKASDKKWKKRYTYGGHGGDVFHRGELVKIQVNNDEDLDTEVEELYTYNVQGLVAKGIKAVDYDANGATNISCQHNNLRQVTQVDYGAGLTPVLYGYDIRGRLKSIGNSTNAKYYASYS